MQLSRLLYLRQERGADWHQWMRLDASMDANCLASWIGTYFGDRHLRRAVCCPTFVFAGAWLRGYREINSDEHGSTTKPLWSVLYINEIMTARRVKQNEQGLVPLNASRSYCPLSAAHNYSTVKATTCQARQSPCLLSFLTSNSSNEAMTSGEWQMSAECCSWIQAVVTLVIHAQYAD